MKYSSEDAIAERKERKKAELADPIGVRSCEYRLCHVDYGQVLTKKYAFVLSGREVNVSRSVSPPTGFRLMEEGEQIKEDDLYLSTSGNWEDVPEPCVGHPCPAPDKVSYATSRTHKHRFRSIDDPWSS